MTDELDGQLRSQVLLAARELARRLDDVWGHVTCRIPDGGDGSPGFYLKHLRIPRGGDPDHVNAFGYDGRAIDGGHEIPWEIPLYTQVYAARPDVQSVIHIHPPVATAISTAGHPIHAVTHEGLEFGEGLPVYSGEIVGDNVVGDNVADTLGSGPACMLKGHGAVVVGTSVPDATVRAIYLERTAKQLVWASSFGGAEVLPQEIRDDIESRRAGDERPPALWRYIEWTTTGE
ncbi:MAG TPA: class II aldolase/adducin family protein [Candidatus Limnocylindria bacterium]|nr:class II aldolase/adducin family protein [Candidatus Limnocylindria bacterium]